MYITCILIGQDNLLIECGKILIEHRHKIKWVVSPLKAIQTWCENNNIAWVRSLNELAFHADNVVDYIFSIVNGTILTSKDLQFARCGAINYHDSLLPAYAGVNATSWAIINNENAHGITWHMITEGIDEGEIVYQKSFAVESTATALSLNLQCFEEAINGFLTVIDMIETSSVTKRMQQKELRSYYGKNSLLPDLGFINWRTTTASSIEAMCRALMFGNYYNKLGVLKLYLNNNFIIVTDVMVMDSSIAVDKAGIIIDIQENGILVSTSTQPILLKKFMTADGKFLSKDQLVQDYGLYVNYEFPSTDAGYLENNRSFYAKALLKEEYWLSILLNVIEHNVFSDRINKDSNFTELNCVSFTKFLDKHIDLYSYLFAAVLLYLYRLNNYEDFTVFMCSHQSSSQDSIGLFSSFLPLTTVLQNDLSCAEFINTVIDQCNLLKKHGHFLSDIYIRHPDLMAYAEKSILTVSLANDNLNNIPENSLLHFSISENTNSIRLYHRLNLQYQGGLLTDIIGNMSSHLNNILTFLINFPDKKIHKFSFLTEEEKNKLLSWGVGEYIQLPSNNFLKDQDEYAQVKTVSELFAEQVKKTPDNIALEFNGVTFTYRQLDETTNQLARYIRKEYHNLTQNDLIPNTLISICIDRSADYVIGILSILKAGSAYVPINPKYPMERIRFILQDTKSVLMLTANHFAEKFNTENIKTILLDENLFLRESKYPLNDKINCYDAAYVIYTSGSTGAPKGVLAQHVNIVAQVKSATYFNVDESDTMTFFSDVAFDSTIVEIWGALLNGAKLFIPNNLFNLLSDPCLLKKTIGEYKITILVLTRSLFDMLYALDETIFASLKFLLVGGEALTKNLMLKLLKSKYKPHHVVNCYGPTENCTFCITNDIKEDFSHLSSVPIGRPFSNRVGYVVDRHLQLLPCGIEGELYVGGPSLTKGYLNLPDLTQARFIANPFDKYSGGRYPRIYKTNDLVKWLPNGNLEFSTRNDFQVKLRGYRIELGEIETNLLEFSGIKHCVVLLKQNNEASYLIAYYVAEQHLNENDIRSYLSTKLPDYMVPSVFMFLASLPVTTNGKLDRKALPEPQFKADKKNFVNKHASVHQTIYNIWCKVLNLTDFCEDESFFKLGGNSITAMMVRKQIEDTFEIKLNIVELFQYTTLAKLVEYISSLIFSSAKKTSDSNMSSIRLSNSQHEIEPIAVVGMACRLPQCKNIDDFWQLILNEQSNIRDFSQEELRSNYIDASLISSDTYVKRGALLEDVFCFDANFFGYSVKDAEIMDPQQRQFLECIWEGLEYSGNVPEKFDGEIGVFASQGRNYYFMESVYANKDYMHNTTLLKTILGNEKDFLSTRVSFKLNLTGPSVNIQTACSSSLVAVQMACESLQNHGCDLALAGGVSLFYNYGYKYKEDMIESPDGFCRAFDAKAKGTVVTSGMGVVVLKRLTDAIKQRDTIYAIIKGGAINNDGAAKMAFTAPSINGQIAVIEKALRNANVSPESINYIEAHGTGTLVGDPIEWTALHHVYEKHTNQVEAIKIGSVKTNIGHTDAAAGVMGLIKAVLALKHKIIPATLNFKTLNPEIALFNKLFKVVNETTNWENDGKIRRAAVSSFGLGGTNSHVILEEYNDQEEKSSADKSDVCHFLVPFSAKNSKSLFAMATKLKEYIMENDPINFCDIAFTAQQGRAEFKERGYFVLTTSPKNKEDIIKVTFIRDSNYLDKPKIIFVLSKLTIESVLQLQKLYNRYTNFKKAFDNCSVIAQQKFAIDISSFFLGENYVTPINSYYEKLLIFSAQYALVQLFLLSNIEPYGVIADDFGMFAAGVMCGVFSLENALTMLMEEEPQTSVKAFCIRPGKKLSYKIFSRQNNRWSSAEEIRTSDFWLTNFNSIELKLNFSYFDNESLFVSMGNCLSECDQYILNTGIFHEDCECTEIAWLKSIGWLWSHGVTISWEKINICKNTSKKIPIPLYVFNKHHYKIPNTPQLSETQIPNLSTSPQSSLHIELKEMWAKALGLSTDAIVDCSDFFKLGGDSMALLDLFDRIKQSFVPSLVFSELIKHSEFAAMLNFLLNCEIKEDVEFV